ncbi:hypothetical protein OKW33_007047 [Paraburkholderia atlantica]
MDTSQPFFGREIRPVRSPTNPDQVDGSANDCCESGFSQRTERIRQAVSGASQYLSAALRDAKPASAIPLDRRRSRLSQRCTPLLSIVASLPPNHIPVADPDSRPTARNSTRIAWLPLRNRAVRAFGNSPTSPVRSHSRTINQGAAGRPSDLPTSRDARLRSFEGMCRDHANHRVASSELTSFRPEPIFPFWSRMSRYRLSLRQPLRSREIDNAAPGASEINPPDDGSQDRRGQMCKSSST